jgi:hypothetical protein
MAAVSGFYPTAIDGSSGVEKWRDSIAHVPACVPVRQPAEPERGKP